MYPRSLEKLRKLRETLYLGLIGSLRWGYFWSGIKTQCKQLLHIGIRVNHDPFFICTSQHPALQRLRLFPWQISSSACTPKNWKCASKAGTLGKFTLESSTNAIWFTSFQNYERIIVKCPFFVVQKVSTIYSYYSIITLCTQSHNYFPQLWSFEEERVSQKLILCREL